MSPLDSFDTFNYHPSENLYMWHDVDGNYPDACLVYSSPSYYQPSFYSDPVPDCAGYRHAVFDPPSHPQAQDNPYIVQLAQQFRNTSGRPQVQDHHRSSIARASDSFLAQASSIFSDGHPSKRATPSDYRSSIPHQTTLQRDVRPLPRKRCRDSSDGATYHLEEGDDNVHSSSLPPANDTCRLPQPHLVAPPQVLPPSSVRVSRRADVAGSHAHAHEHEPRLRLEERCAISLPKHMSNKRVHRSGEDLVRPESTTILSIPSTWPIPDDQAMKAVKKPGEQKKQALACLFCRERKIACGRPPPHSPDQTCNQCARRRMKCEYPTESRRGQHKRRRKPMESEPATARTNPMPTVAPTMPTPSSTTLTTTTTPSA